MPNPVLEPLLKRSEYLAVSKKGERWVTPAFIIQAYERASEGACRYGITASKKVGGAVDRNRAKRRLRALLKDNLPQIAVPGIDYVFIARQEILKRNFALMAEELKLAIKRLNQKKTGSHAN